MTHSLDYSQSAQFIEALTGDQNTPCTWQTFSEDKTLTREEANKKQAIRHGSLAQLWPQFLKWQDDKRGIFVTVQETDLNGRKEENITALRTCSVDIDPPKDEHGNPRPFTEQEQAEIRARLNSAPLPPHLIVFSGSGIHAYWLLEPGQAIEAFRETQKHLICFFDSDKAVHDLPRVMRVPGTLNLKSDPRPAIILEAHDRPRVTLEQIRAAYPVPEAAKPKRTTPTYSPVNLDSDYAHVLTYIEQV